MENNIVRLRSALPGCEKLQFPVFYKESSHEDSFRFSCVPSSNQWEVEKCEKVNQDVLDGWKDGMTDCKSVIVMPSHSMKFRIIFLMTAKYFVEMELYLKSLDVILHTHSVPIHVEQLLFESRGDWMDLLTNQFLLLSYTEKISVLF